MKLVCLNIWGGKVYGPLADFIRRNSDADIFCLQEVFRSERSTTTREGYRTDIFSAIGKALKGHKAFFAPMAEGLAGYNPVYFVDFDLKLGLATFVKNGHKTEHGMEIVHRGSSKIKDSTTDVPRVLQYVRLPEITVFNFHGIATWPKTDTAARLRQSKRARNLIDSFSGRKILCGDFNLWPETESMRILGKGMRNLVTEYGIRSTRSRLFTKEDLLSDYMLVSPDVKVKTFAVPDVAVSDHLPLILEFD